MASRGDVLVAKRALGFAPADGEERFVVLQHDQLNATLPTVLVAPLDADSTVYSNSPLAIPVTANEAGTSASQVLVVTSLACAPWTAFKAGAVGRLDAPTLSRVDTVLRLVLGLP